MFGAFTGAAASVYGTYRTMELEEKRVSIYFIDEMCTK